MKRRCSAVLVSLVFNSLWVYAQGVAADKAGFFTPLAPAAPPSIHFGGGLQGRASARPAPVGRFGSIPAHFEANRGQFANQVKFVAKTQTGSAWFTADELVLAADPKSTGSPLRMRFAQGRGVLEGTEYLAAVVNYIRGSDARSWRTGIPTYARLIRRGVYPGIDVQYRASDTGIEYDLLVSRDADARRIRLHFDGAEKLSISKEGDLQVRNGSKTIIHRLPTVFQQDASRTPVAAHYRILSRSDVAIEIDQHDPAQSLVIDPAIVYSTYIGGTAGSFVVPGAVAAATDPVSGKTFAIVAGTTGSADFPTVNPLQGALRGEGDAFIAKFDPAASGAASLISATYFGGSGGDGISAIAVDSSGNVYATGSTDSPDFPLLNGATGIGETFVTKFSPDLRSILYSTRFGGSGTALGLAIAAGANGSAYVAGVTSSVDMPLVNPFQTFLHQSGFIARFNTLGFGPSSLTYSTYLSGASVSPFPPDTPLGIAVDTIGNIYVVGHTDAIDLPIVNGFDSSNSAQNKGFLAKLNPMNSSASQLLYSTYIGGSNSIRNEATNAVAVDAAGNAYVTGTTSSPYFPTTPGAFQGTSNSPNHSAYATKINTNLSGSASLVYSTLLGGGTGFTIALDGSGNAFVAGATDATDFPMLHPVQAPINGIFQSSDFGDHWTPLTNGAPQTFVSDIIVDTTASPRVLYASASGFGLIPGPPATGVFKSADGGLSWVPSSAGLQGRWVLSLAMDPASAATLYAGTDQGAYKSTDAGATWSPFNGSGGTMSERQVWALAFAGSVLCAETNGGFFVYSAGTWSPIGPRADGSLGGITVDSTTSPTIYVTDTRLHMSTDQGQNWTDITPPGAGVMSPIALDSKTSPATVYAWDNNSSEVGSPPLWVSADRGSNWTLIEGSAPLAGVDNGGFAPVFVGIDSSRAPSVLYLSTFSGVWRSTDGGANWQQLLRMFVNSATIDATAASATNPATLYVGTGYTDESGFVAEMNPSASGLVFSTVLGGFEVGPGTNRITSLARTPAGNLFVAGRTQSTSLPTVNAYQPSNPVADGGYQTAFFAVLGDAQVALSASNCGTNCAVTTSVSEPNGTLSVTFPVVSGSATSSPATLTVTTLSSIQTANFSLSNNLGAFDISTTAVYTASPSNPVTLCFQALTVNDPSTFAGLTVLHVVNGMTVDVTSSRDFASRTICGAVTSFSPFVIVKGAADQIQDIVRYVNGLDLQKGINVSLDAKLQNAISGLNAARGHDYGSACNQMAAFASAVQAQTGQSLTTTQAAFLLSATKQVRATMGCSP